MRGGARSGTTKLLGGQGLIAFPHDYTSRAWVTATAGVRRRVAARNSVVAQVKARSHDVTRHANGLNRMRGGANRTHTAPRQHTWPDREKPLLSTLTMGAAQELLGPTASEKDKAHSSPRRRSAHGTWGKGAQRRVRKSKSTVDPGRRCEVEPGQGQQSSWEARV